jgi:hypothetical protein
MAITTLDGALAGMQPPVAFYKQPVANFFAAFKWSTLWAANGFPGPGSYNSTRTPRQGRSMPTSPGGPI